ncbi:anthranilate synthase component II [Salisaeta longa]|uniref:anthranilate synthase component II n=1 Tax=Salisaeta longa TaxID=503170 RepID=UPI0003B4BA42|nr:aminodeoxychorismate/anthranilate synthase component II [Salisaeta longa]
MILVIDNYDSFTYNLVHLVGEHTDEVTVVRNDAFTLADVRDLAPRGILISPGPGRPADAGLSEPVIETFGAAIPILGVCLGHQAIGEVYGATVTQAPELMHGKTCMVHHDNQSVFAGLPQPFEATRYHSLALDPDTIPQAHLEVTARSDEGTIMGIRHRAFLVEGVQFHPESVMTKVGRQMIGNWLEQLKPLGDHALDDIALPEPSPASDTTPAAASDTKDSGPATLIFEPGSPS